MDNQVEMPNRTFSDIQGYANRHGKKGQKMVSRILSSLGKNEQFLNAVNSTLGKELLTDLVNMMEESLDKIIDESATEVERANFRVGRDLSLRWVEKINNYYNNLKQLKEG